KAKFSGSPVIEVSAWSFYSILPKEEIKGRGQYNLRRQDSIYGMPSGTAENILGREIEKLTSMRMPIKTSKQGTGSRGIFIERIPQGTPSALPPEGFEIITSPEKIVIRGTSDRACLYATYAVMGRLKHEANNWEMECGTIRDWPDLPVRGVCIELLKPAIRDVTLMKSYLNAFSRARSNVVIFLHTPQQMRSWKRNANDGGWTKEQMTEIARYARSLHMDVWGGMLSRFEAANFREIEISKGAKIYNPFKDRSYEYIFSLYEEILQTYRPSTLLICHDEIIGLSIYSAESGKTSADILAMDVGRIHDWLGKNGVKTAMWGDMLLDYNVWDTKTGAANSQNPFFKSGATHHAVKKLPSDLIILDWHYNEKKDYGSINYFRQNGFSAIGSPWHNPKAARTLAQSVKNYGGQGILTTDWGFFSTLSSSATTLYGPLCAWTTECVIDDKNKDVEALAETMRGGIYQTVLPKQIEISLAGITNNSLGSSSDGNGKGLFGIGPVLDLSAFSPGRQVLGKVSFDVVSDEGGRRNNCVVVTSFEEGDNDLPNQAVVFQENMAANAIAFLHTGFVEEPQFRPRKIGKYDVKYANGITETIDLIENWNITDIRSSEGLRHNDWSFFRSPDVLIGAKTGWRGSSASGVPLNVQVFIWKNPNPAQKIRSIRLSAAETPMKSKIALLGLTFLQ
ncbi:beta-N-acetylhexosaminidase, partial [bacterium]|nr:beta-N-acetylhexosaminidase [bacterium]